MPEQLQRRQSLPSVVTAVTVTSAGAGYTSAPTVSISGGGTGALAVANLFYNITAVGDPDALFVGNYYEGPNMETSPDDSFIEQFFNPTISVRDGIADLYGTGDDPIPDPQDYSFRHPLNAELHELKIYNAYRDEDADLFGKRLWHRECIHRTQSLILSSTIFCQRH